jgi:hypothetical protein
MKLYAWSTYHCISWNSFKKKAAESVSPAGKALEECLKFLKGLQKDHGKNLLMRPWKGLKELYSWKAWQRFSATHPFADSGRILRALY